MEVFATTVLEGFPEVETEVERFLVRPSIFSRTAGMTGVRIPKEGDEQGCGDQPIDQIPGFWF